jgi:hypothetical protein
MNVSLAIRLRWKRGHQHVVGAVPTSDEDFAPEVSRMKNGRYCIHVKLKDSLQ